jgi:hypothetical protein
MYDVDDFLKQASAELAQYESHEQQFQGLLGENERRATELRQRQEAAWAQLGATALPVPTEEALSRLAVSIRLPGLQKIADEITERRAEIDRFVAEIDALPQYQDRERRRVHIQAELDETQPLHDFAQSELQKLQKLPGMDELYQERWGTRHYEHRGVFRFFNKEFLEDWRRSDDIVKALGVANFAEAASRYKTRLENAREMTEALQRLHAEQKRLDKLEQDRQNLLDEREALPETLQQRAGQMLAQMLETRGQDGARDLPVPENALRAYAAIEGITHQTRYLEEMSGRMRGDLSQLMERSGRLREETRRYEGNRHRYRNKRFTDEQFGKRFGRTERYGKIHDRYSRMSERVYVFHDYDRGFGVQDFLWWDVMTDGRFDGNFIPEVAEWRHHHPHHSYISDHGSSFSSSSRSSASVFDDQS